MHSLRLSLLLSSTQNRPKNKTRSRSIANLLVTTLHRYIRSFRRALFILVFEEVIQLHSIDYPLDCATWCGFGCIAYADR